MLSRRAFALPEATIVEDHHGQPVPLIEDHQRVTATDDVASVPVAEECDADWVRVIGKPSVKSSSIVRFENNVFEWNPVAR